MPEMTKEDAQSFSDVTLSAEERNAIEEALNSDVPWKHTNFKKPTQDLLQSAKYKIKLYHLCKTDNNCCYCRRSLLGDNIGTDREHIVPKGHSKSLSYNIFNLSVACKRCNMTIKGTRLDHIVNPDTIEADLWNPDRYLIPHPNLAKYEDHMVRTSVQTKGKEITAYRRITDEGKFLYNFFKLDELCVGGFDSAQGGKEMEESIAALFPHSIRGI